MCRKLRLWDNDIRVCGEKIWKKNRKNGIWKRVDNLKPNNWGYSLITLTDDNSKRKSYQLSRIVYKAYNPDWNIFDISMNNYIDHIDNNRINNHIDNLRVVTQQQNCFNTNSKGCYYNKRSQKWAARIMLDRKCIHLGYYKAEEEARNAYLKAKEIYHII